MEPARQHTTTAAPRVTGYGLKNQQRKAETAKRVSTPLQKESVALPQQLRDAGMQKEQAELIGKGFERTADGIADLVEVIYDSNTTLHDALVDEMDKRFEQVDKRFEQVDKRFEQMQQQMDKRFDQMQQQMDKRFDQMDERNRQENHRNRMFTLFVASIIITVNLAAVGAFSYMQTQQMQAMEQRLIERIDNHQHAPSTVANKAGTSNLE